MRDTGAIRLLKRLALWRFQVDLSATRAINRALGRAPLFHLRGTCNGCGACCREVALVTGRLVFHLGLLRRLFLAWQFRVNGFRLVRADAETRTFYFSCDHYDAATNQCDSYDSRPGVCRHYPVNLLDGVAPEFFPECSFYAELKTAARFREALADVDLPPDARARLEARLHIKK